jgi:hypothetical protein
VLVASLTQLACFAEAFAMKPGDPVFRGEIAGPESREANATQWPSTFVFRSATDTECTATAIGEQAILTAAHCVEPLDAGTVEIDRRLHNVSCKHHTSYPRAPSADFALCLVTPSLPIPALGFEVVNTAASATTQGTQIKLLGFGCRYPGGADQRFGRLSEGDAAVLEVRTDYLVTGGGAAVCLGDSGGGAYIAIDADGIRRRLVAVASYGDLNNLSWLSMTAGSLFITWAKGWSQDHNVVICGLHESARGCHQ